MPEELSALIARDRTLRARGARRRSADTVVMGSTLANPYEGGIMQCADGHRAALLRPGDEHQPGRLPRERRDHGGCWKVKSADDGALYTLKVLRPNGPVSLVTTTNSNFTGISSVAAPSAVPAGTGRFGPRRA